MKDGRYQQELGATEACTKRMMEATKGIGQNSIEGGTKDCLIFGIWFASKKASESAMEMGCRVDRYGEEKYQRILRGDN